MVDHGIKPAYVFDGKPPELKGGVVSPFPNNFPVLSGVSDHGFVFVQLAKRFAARSAAAEAEEEAKETGKSLPYRSDLVTCLTAWMTTR